MSIPVKPNSFAEIFAKNDSEIDESIAKGYLCRREVTEILDHVSKKNALKLESDGNGGFIWKVGSATIDPNQKTNKTPFWMRRISHWFKMRCSSKYREKFEDKVVKVHEAYETYLANKAKAVSDAQAQANAAQQALADAQTQAQALLDAQALQQLQDNIVDKEAAITPVQTELDQLNQELLALNTTKTNLERDIQTTTSKIDEHTTNHTDLTSLDTRLNNYLLKGAWLEEEDKPEVKELEERLYGMGNSNDQFRSPENRSAYLNRIAQQKTLEETAKGNLEADLRTCEASIGQKTTDRDLKQTEFDTLNDELVQLRAQLPSDDELVVDVPDDTVIDNEPVTAEPKKLNIKEILEGESDIDPVKMRVAQDFDNNPLRNKKALFISIANQDELYTNTIVPGLKLITSVLAPNTQKADEMFNKWKNGLENCASLWKASGAEDQDIDNLIPIDVIFDNVMKINEGLSFLAKTNLNAGEFFNHLNTLKIPENMKLTFAVTDEKAEEILNAYLENPADTNLKPLFSYAAIKSWPKDCQFFLALSMLKIRFDNEKLASTKEFRDERLNSIAEAQSVEEPVWLGPILGLARSKLAFKIGLRSINGLLPAIDPEALRLAESKANLIESSADKKLTEEDEAKFEAAFTFAKTKKRMDFDKAYVKFATELRTELINAVVAKHNIGQEIDLYKVVNAGIDLRSPAATLLEKQKNYINALEKFESTGKNSDKVTKARKELEEVQGQLAINSLHFIKSLSQFFVNNPTFIKVTQALDDDVMVTMRTQEPINLETTPFIPWLQDTVLKPISEVV